MNSNGKKNAADYWARITFLNMHGLQQSVLCSCLIELGSVFPADFKNEI